MRTTQRKGDIAVSRAIAYFTEIGCDVSIPITESAPYDLLVDSEVGIRRVQVKYAGSDEIDLRCIHSNSKGYVIKKQRKTHTIGCMYIRKKKENI